MSNDGWNNLTTITAVADAQLAGWEIEYRAHETYEWRTWKGKIWEKDWLFHGRPKQPQEVVIPCYFTGNGLTWSLVSMPEWIRIPEQDKTIKVTK